MPVYTYACPQCGKTLNAYRPIERRDSSPPQCPAHPVSMVRQIDAPMGIVKGPAVPRGNG
jgi:putative FmdB family regulatory protein